MDHWLHVKKIRDRDLLCRRYWKRQNNPLIFLAQIFPQCIQFFIILEQCSSEWALHIRIKTKIWLKAISWKVSVYFSTQSSAKKCNIPVYSDLWYSLFLFLFEDFQIYGRLNPQARQILISERKKGIACERNIAITKLVARSKPRTMTPIVNTTAAVCNGTILMIFRKMIIC